MPGTEGANELGSIIVAEEVDYSAVQDAYEAIEQLTQAHVQRMQELQGQGLYGGGATAGVQAMMGGGGGYEYPTADQGMMSGASGGGGGSVMPSAADAIMAAGVGGASKPEVQNEKEVQGAVKDTAQMRADAAIKNRSDANEDIRTFRTNSMDIQRQIGYMSSLQGIQRGILDKIFGTAEARINLSALSREYISLTRQITSGQNLIESGSSKAPSQESVNALIAQRDTVQKGQDTIKAGYTGIVGAVKGVSSQFLNMAMTAAIATPALAAVQMGIQILTQWGSSIYQDITDPLHRVRDAADDITKSLSAAGAAGKMLSNLGIGDSSMMLGVINLGKEIADRQTQVDGLAKLLDDMKNMKGGSDIFSAQTSSLVPHILDMISAQGLDQGAAALGTQAADAFWNAFRAAQAKGGTQQDWVQAGAEAMAAEALSTTPKFEALGDAVYDATNPDVMRKNLAQWSFEDVQTKFSNFSALVGQATSDVAAGLKLDTDEINALNQIQVMGGPELVAAVNNLQTLGDKVKNDNQQIKDTSRQNAQDDYQHQVDLINGYNDVTGAIGRTLTPNEQTKAILEDQLQNLQDQDKARQLLNEKADITNSVIKAGIAMAGESGFEVTARVLQAKQDAQQKLQDWNSQNQQNNINLQLRPLDKEIQVQDLTNANNRLLASQKLQDTLETDTRNANLATRGVQNLETAAETTQTRWNSILGQIMTSSGETADQLGPQFMNQFSAGLVANPVSLATWATALSLNFPVAGSGATLGGVPLTVPAGGSGANPVVSTLGDNPNGSATDVGHPGTGLVAGTVGNILRAGGAILGGTAGAGMGAVGNALVTGNSVVPTGTLPQATTAPAGAAMIGAHAWVLNDGTVGIAPGYGNGNTGWVSVAAWQAAGSPGKAVGGMIPGYPGQPQMIQVEGGEQVLNRQQQATRTANEGGPQILHATINVTIPNPLTGKDIHTVIEQDVALIQYRQLSGINYPLAPDWRSN